MAEFVAKRHNMTFAQLLSVRRNRDVVRPRQIAMYAIRELCPHMSFPAIGRMLGGRDHTTILHGVRKIEELIPTQDLIDAEVSLTLAHFRNMKEPPVDLMLSARIDATSKHLEVLILEARTRVSEARLSA
ncbi:hypothetical protein HNP32_003440 [Brevundimonas bullata]|uniref:Chromosomal replication initiator DnaA C-terminal domain-containing protein n=1 Tax=Brevundimonas bullata TaxID=13160 RepID=A0A7W7ITI4_9CAUL|nr:helix-turn-helix domain-containing protein [Brevundimonas bullata]MBB4799680.1 hypothetical protein [Brevundimonas bullata]MBB6384698.1 hypothetical protein [Brevundimonas bullata]